MIRGVAKYLTTIPPVFIDGLVWVLIAEFAFCQSYFGTDEASKYIAAAARFWVLFGIGSGAVMTGALKMFRSTSYADHQVQKKEAADSAHPFSGVPGAGPTRPGI